MSKLLSQMGIPGKTGYFLRERCCVRLLTGGVGGPSLA